MSAHLPADNILHAPVLHCNGQIPPFVEAPKGSVGGVAAGCIGACLGGLGWGPLGWATPMSLDGVSLPSLQVMIGLLAL